MSLATTLRPAARMSLIRTETAFEILARAKALEDRGQRIVNLGIGQPDFAPPPHVVEAAIKALKDGHHGYTPAGGIAPLREAVAADIARRYRVTLDPAQVVIVPGGKVTIFFAALMFGAKGTEILYPDPGFPIYASAAAFSGATPVPYPLHEARGFAFAAEDLLARITSRTRLVILNSPANPTGGVTPREEITRLAAGLARHPQVAVLADEIYSRMLYGGARHTSLLEFPEIREQVILLDGWSKTYAMTGWRLGYGVWPQALVEGATRLAVNCHSCVNAATQYAGIAALSGPQDSVEAMVAAFAERRAYLVAALNAIPGLRCVEPGGAFYAFPNIGASGLSAKALETALLEKAGVATIAGTSFGAQGEGYLRLSYAAGLGELEEAAARIAGWLKDHQG